MTDLNYEIAQAEYRLFEIRRDAEEYFTYDDGSTDPPNHWFLVFEEAIKKIMRREPVKLGFGPQGSPTWYKNTFEIFAKWIEAEHEHCKLLSRQCEAMDF